MSSYISVLVTLIGAVVSNEIEKGKPHWNLYYYAAKEQKVL